jgi:predicted DNA-binding protein
MSKIIAMKHQITMRVSQEDYEDIKTLIRLSGKSMATLLREVLMNSVREQMAKHEIYKQQQSQLPKGGNQ